MTTPQYQEPIHPPPPHYQPSAPATNALAIVSLVMSLVSIGFAPLAIVGIVTGHIARRQIRDSGEGGDGLALAGLIVGYIISGLMVLAIIVYVLIIVGMFAFMAAGAGTTP